MPPLVATSPTLHVSRHPAVLHKLALLRTESTEPKKFRELGRASCRERVLVTV